MGWRKIWHWCPNSCWRNPSPWRFAGTRLDRPHAKVRAWLDQNSLFCWTVRGWQRSMIWQRHVLLSGCWTDFLHFKWGQTKKNQSKPLSSGMPHTASRWHPFLTPDFWRRCHWTQPTIYSLGPHPFKSFLGTVWDHSEPCRLLYSMSFLRQLLWRLAFNRSSGPGAIWPNQAKRPGQN